MNTNTYKFHNLNYKYDQLLTKYVTKDSNSSTMQVRFQSAPYERQTYFRY